MKKKAKSPSQLRREERRRVKRQNKVAEEVTEETAVAEEERNSGKVTEKGACDQCDFKTTTEKGLKQHKTKKHEKQQQQQNPSSALVDTPEKPRNRSQVERALTTSPLPISTREENCNNCGCPFSPSHQCEDADQGVEDAEPDTFNCDQDDEDCEVDEVIEAPIICSCGCGAPERCPRHFEVMESGKQMLNMILEQRKKFNFK